MLIDWLGSEDHNAVAFVSRPPTANPTWSPRNGAKASLDTLDKFILARLEDSGAAVGMACETTDLGSSPFADLSGGGTSDPVLSLKAENIDCNPEGLIREVFSRVARDEGISEGVRAASLLIKSCMRFVTDVALPANNYPGLFRVEAGSIDREPTSKWESNQKTTSFVFRQNLEDE